MITGAGNKAFVAGADIGEIARIETPEDGAAYSRSGQRVFSKIERLTKPVIMAINGYALGGGCELAMCGDMRIAADTAQLGQPEINLGVIPGYGGTQRLARLVGRDRAKWLIFSGSASQALTKPTASGLVDRVVAAADLLEEAMTLARSLAGKPQGTGAGKDGHKRRREMPLSEALEHEATLFGQAADTQDRREGTAAFLEKRQPQWTGQ